MTSSKGEIKEDDDWGERGDEVGSEASCEVDEGSARKRRRYTRRTSLLKELKASYTT